MAEQRLFISHASEDAAVADKIVAYLEARGVPCWISSRDIPPRAIYAEEITKGIQECGACAVILSKASNASAAVKRELELASHYGKPFIPIRIDATEPGPGADYYLRNTQWIDYRRDGDGALDRIAAHIKGNPQPPTPSRPRRGAGPMMIGGGALAIALLGVGAWFSWTQFTSQPAATQTANVSAETLAPLLGSYNWEGVECGRGPTITYEDSALVFAMPDTPTFRHEVLSATLARSGFALEVRSRVIAPEEHAGESYTLGLNGNELQVRTQDQNDAWTRCDIAVTQEPSPAVASRPGLAGSRWRGSYTSNLGVTTEVGWLLNADGSACWINAQERGGCDTVQWRTEGNRLTIFSEPGNPRWDGTIAGSTYSGTITDNTENSPYSFTMRRL